jgi:hypothetical protein
LLFPNATAMTVSTVSVVKAALVEIWILWVSANATAFQTRLSLSKTLTALFAGKLSVGIPGVGRTVLNRQDGDQMPAAPLESRVRTRQ